MTRRDYQLLTDVLKIARQHSTTERANTDTYTIDGVVHLLASALTQDNKAFDRDKFINDIRGL